MSQREKSTMNSHPPPAPPLPPPHGHNHGNRNGLPDGNYDISIIPPHSSGRGFIYLPSLQPHLNSFIAGVVCTLLGVIFWIIVIPVFKEWFSAVVAGGGMSVFMLCLAIGVAIWALDKTYEQIGGSGQGDNGGVPTAHMPGQSAGGHVPGSTPGFGAGPSAGFNSGPGYTPGPNTDFTEHS